MRPPVSVVFSCMILAGGASSVAAQRVASSLPDQRVRALACAPVSPAVRPAFSIQVSGEPGGPRSVFGPGDRLVVSAGAGQTMRVGDEYFVRRVIDDKYLSAADGGKRPLNLHTAGVVRIVESGPGGSVATVTVACDGIASGDFLEPFSAPALPQADSGGAPDFSAPARVILGAERRQIAGPNEFMVIDRGSDQGLRSGQRLTVFRAGAGGSGPVTAIGAATVHAVQAGSATVRIDTSVDAVYVGDLVAIHR